MGFSDLAATVIYLLMATRISMVKSFNILFVVMAISSIFLVIILGFSNAED